MIGLSDRERAVLACILAFHVAEGRSPSLREIAVAIGVKDTHSVARVVTSLRQQRVLSRSLGVRGAGHSLAGGLVISREAQIHLQSQASL